jgi:Uma2 family endonuclease
MPHVADVTANSLLRDFLAFEEPECYRAELIDGEIVLTPPPDGSHQVIIGEIIKQVISKAPKMVFSGHKGLIVSDRGAAGAGRVIPDITILPSRILCGAPPWMEPAGVTMVVEVTLSQPARDRDTKRVAYASAGIPLYLLVDREFGLITLFSDPVGGDYAVSLIVPSGTGLQLPAPFSFTLETASFPV